MNLNRLWSFKNNGLYIDLGTANTLVMSQNKGLVLNEPSVISYRLTNGKKAIVSVGQKAFHNIGRTPENFFTCYPLREGVIADMDTTEAMLRYFFNRAKRSFNLRPHAIISLPHGVSAVERKAVQEAGVTAGASEVTLVEEPLLAAIGSDLPILAPMGNMVIDIGAGTTEIAVISLSDIVHCESIRIGGNSFDRAIVEFVKNQYNLIIGEPTAEKAKMEIGSAEPYLSPAKTVIRGLDFTTHLPKEISISSADIYTAIRELLNQILDSTRRTLELIPPDLLPDIADRGIHIVGGGALLRDLRKRFEEELKIPIHIGSSPLFAVAHGGAKVLQSRQLLERIRLH